MSDSVTTLQHRQSAQAQQGEGSGFWHSRGGRRGAGVPVAQDDVQVGDAHEPVAGRIGQLALEYDVVGIVVGFPLNMDDSEGPQAKLARQMAAELAEATGLDVRLWDERLSSFAADQLLAGKYTRKQKKARQDAVAAASMLTDFLASSGPERAIRP